MPSVAVLNDTQQTHFPLVAFARKNYVDFKILSYSDVARMLSDNCIQNNFELHHICSELAQNMLEENNFGVVRITPNKVINTVKYNNVEDFQDKCDKFINGLQLAKSSREKTWNGSSIGKTGSLNRGRGLSSILKMGWDIDYFLTAPRQLSIEVSRH